MKRILISVILALTLATLLAVPTVAAPPGPTIVDVAITVNSEGPFAGAFDTLIAAVLAADPAVLAPTDDAFAALGLDETNIGTLPQGFLTDVLLYHVARGLRYAEDVLASDRIRTLYGGFLFQDGEVLTDNLDRDANIIVMDVEAANGIIHAIDAVVLPYAP